MIGDLLHRGLLPGGEGIAADCLYALLAGGRELSREQRVKAYAACGMLGVLMGHLRRG